MNCARSVYRGVGKKGQNYPGNMTVTIPKRVPFDSSHGVLRWVWIATHFSTTNPEQYEYYDNCADLKIVGAQVEAASAAPLQPTSSSAVWQPNIAIGQGYVQHMINYALVDGGISNEKGILTMKRLIETLSVERSLESGPLERAHSNNKRGIEYLRDGRVAEAVQTFEAAYQAAPNNAEIINKLGYAHLRKNDPWAAEPLLLLALVFEPG